MLVKAGAVRWTMNCPMPGPLISIILNLFWTTSVPAKAGFKSKGFSIELRVPRILAKNKPELKTIQKKINILEG